MKVTQNCTILHHLDICTTGERILYWSFVVHPWVSASHSNLHHWMQWPTGLLQLAPLPYSSKIRASPEVHGWTAADIYWYLQHSLRLYISMVYTKFPLTKVKLVRGWSWVIGGNGGLEGVGGWWRVEGGGGWWGWGKGVKRGRGEGGE
jgi:hypothetical protein